MHETLGALAAARPTAVTVFLRHRLDFCCRGGRTLAEACAEAGLDPEALQREIEHEPERGPAVRWESRPLAELVDHILERYHAPLHRDLAALVAAAARVEERHADKPSCPHGLLEHLTHLEIALGEHLAKEERVLFPILKSGGRGQGLYMPVRVMLQEHDDHGESLARLRALAHDFVPPPEACATWRGLYAALEQLEADLMAHIHLENHVLFPRALED